MRIPYKQQLLNTFMVIMMIVTAILLLLVVIYKDANERLQQRLHQLGFETHLTQEYGEQFKKIIENYLLIHYSIDAIRDPSLSNDIFAFNSPAFRSMAWKQKKTSGIINVVEAAAVIYIRVVEYTSRKAVVQSCVSTLTNLYDLDLEKFIDRIKPETVDLYAKSRGGYCKIDVFVFENEKWKIAFSMGTSQEMIRRDWSAGYITDEEKLLIGRFPDDVELDRERFGRLGDWGHPLDISITPTSP